MDEDEGYYKILKALLLTVIIALMVCMFLQEIPFQDIKHFILRK